MEPMGKKKRLPLSSFKPTAQLDARNAGVRQRETFDRTSPMQIEWL
jgi:hypothetical protein